MNSEIFTVDLHCHPNLKPFNSGSPEAINNIWDKLYHKNESRFAQTVSNTSAHILKESQCNLDSMAAGNVRVFNISLYPIEKGFLHLRNIPKILIGKRRIDVMQEVITGFDKDRIRHLKKANNYFQDLEDEYRYVLNQQGKSPDGSRTFILVNNAQELKTALRKKDTLIGIISIEGAHALGTGLPDTDDFTEEEMRDLLSSNIRKLKSWAFPPLTVNLSHHFWNHLAGHATSFKAPINGMVNQNKGKNRGITPAGWHVVREFLSRENGKRILIDTKHMSIESRREYYNFVRNYNYVNPGDTIPIICSHTGVNGFGRMEASVRENDTAAKARKHRFYRWSINLSDEEIRIIHESGGLIGVMMDRGMLGGLQTVRQIAAMKNKDLQKEEYCRLFLDNIFQIIKATGHESGWDVVALGTDFDGTITHMEPYESAAKLPDFQQDLISYLETYRYQEGLWYGHKPATLIRKIMSGNALRFYDRFFI